MTASASASAADVTSVAILGKDNEPLYIREFIRTDNNNDVDDQQHQQDESELLFDLPTTGTGTGTVTASGTATSKCSVRQQFIMYAALDRLDQLAGPPPGYGWRNNNSINKGGADGMFVGLLCPAEDQRVYGYVSTTKIKFLLVTEDDGTSNPVSSSSTSENDSNSENIKLLLTQIHELYVEDMLNPFKIIGSPITSKRFERRIEELIQTFNNISDGMI